jgi:ketosteroid isomerase-like protein
MNFGDFLRVSAGRKPLKTVIVSRERHHSYEEPGRSSAWLARHIAVATVAFALLFSVVHLAAGQPQEMTTTEQTQIVETVNALFVALREENVAKFDSVVSSNFYSFDAGSRFNGEALMALIKALHASGKRYEWNVTEPDVHISGDTAWIAYINKGSITDSSGTKGRQWLESAFLQKQEGIWKIVFVHSTSVPNPTQESRR